MMGRLTPEQEIKDRIEFLTIELRKLNTYGGRKRKPNEIKSMKTELKTLNWVAELYSLNTMRINKPTIGVEMNRSPYIKPARPKY